MPHGLNSPGLARWELASTLRVSAACTYLLWLGLLILWQQLVGQGALESAAQTENAVVGLLWRETFDGCEHDFGLLWDQVVTSIVALVYDPLIL